MTRPRAPHWQWLWLWTALIAAPGGAQTISDRDAGSEDTLVLTLAPYGWIQDFSGSVDDTRPTTASDASTPFAVGALAGGGMIEIRFGATAARFDLVFSQTRSVPAVRQPSGLAASVGTFSRALILDSVIGYRFVERERGSFELYVGVRIAYLGRIATIPLPGDLALHKSEAWGSGIVGGRVIEELGRKWSLDAHADAGGQVRDAFGGSHTWAFEAAVTRPITSRAVFFGGYRGLYEWRDHTPLRFHLGLSGPFAGVRLSSTTTYP